jgi:hypothetical protein
MTAMEIAKTGSYCLRNLRIRSGRKQCSAAVQRMECSVDNKEHTDSKNKVEIREVCLLANFLGLR